MEKTIEYYKLYFKEFWLYIKSSVNWTNGSVALFSLIVGGGYYLILQGREAMLEETINFVAFTLAPLGLLALFLLLYGLIKTPVKIFQSQQGIFNEALEEKDFQIKKVLEEKSLELEKFNWDNVEFYVTPFSIIGKSGWAFEVENKKHYDISKIVVEITKIRKDEKNIPLKGLFLLGYIDRERGQIGEKIVNPHNRGGIASDKNREFVVTSEVKQTNTSRTHKFETYPDELLWDFPTEKDGGVFSDIGASLAVMSAAYYGDNRPPEPTVVIEVCVRAEIKVDNDIIQLPGTKLNLQVMNNGSLSFYGDEDDKRD